MMERKVAMAIGAHPDDIEFSMAGTLVLLREAGWETHYMNLSNGNCGSAEMAAQTTALVRAGEARRAAGILGATWLPPVGSDLEITYSVDLLRRLLAVVRKVNPSLILTHPPQDYMEDHTATCRLAVTAAFAKGIPNFRSEPPAPFATGGVAVYHAMPHGLRDPLRRRVEAGAYVDTTRVHSQKRRALEAHASQRDWLDKSQGMGSYIATMEAFSAEVGAMAGGWTHALGWLLHMY
jgi:LmbE family N-acetylglucosaminyl deacetylase